jgi:hypothetical protein
MSDEIQTDSLDRDTLVRIRYATGKTTRTVDERVRHAEDGTIRIDEEDSDRRFEVRGALVEKLGESDTTNVAGYLKSAEILGAPGVVA